MEAVMVSMILFRISAIRTVITHHHVQMGVTEVLLAGQVVVVVETHHYRLQTPNMMENVIQGEVFTLFA
jgi:hypothetical protein